VELSKLFGLPAHPLLVHIPVVLIPLAALGTVAIVVSSKLRARFGWIVGGVAVAAAIGATLAAGAGESLSETVRSDPSFDAAAVDRHIELGDAARTLSIVFAVVLVGFLALEWWLQRRARRDEVASVGAAKKSMVGVARKWVLPVAAVASLAMGAVATTWVVRAGHTGAKATWERTGNGGGG
jgi:hypothetical protein